MFQLTVKSEADKRNDPVVVEKSSAVARRVVAILWLVGEAVVIRKARGRRGQLSIPKQSATLEVARSAHLTLLNGPL